jgi:hypothetical protein
MLVYTLYLQEVGAAGKIAFNKTRLGEFHLTNIPTQSQFIYITILPANNDENSSPNGPANGNFHAPQGNNLFNVILANSAKSSTIIAININE